jgi:hypothetical protein
MNTYNEQLNIIKNKWIGCMKECARIDEILYNLNEILIKERLNTPDDDGFINLVRFMQLDRLITEDEIDYIENMTGHLYVRNYCKFINSHIKQLQNNQRYLRKYNFEYTIINKRRNRKIIDLTK